MAAQQRDSQTCILPLNSFWSKCYRESQETNVKSQVSLCALGTPSVYCMQHQGRPLWSFINLSEVPPAVRWVRVLPHRDWVGISSCLDQQSTLGRRHCTASEAGPSQGAAATSFPVVFALRASDHL